MKSVPPAPNRIGRWVSIGAAAVAVIGVGAFMLSKQGKGPSDTGTAAVSAPARPAVGATEAVAPPPAPPKETQPPTVTPPPPEPERLPETVQIEFQGITADTTVLVDGKSSALPVRLPRGAEVHKIVLRAPGEAPRTLQIDGTRDRIVEATLPQKPTGADDRTAARGVTSGTGHREKAKRPERAAPAAKPGAADREAITDI
jgi:hypothetical protein